MYSLSKLQFALSALCLWLTIWSVSFLLWLSPVLPPLLLWTLPLKPYAKYNSLLHKLLLLMVFSSQQQNVTNIRPQEARDAKSFKDYVLRKAIASEQTRYVGCKWQGHRGKGTQSSRADANTKVHLRWSYRNCCLSFWVWVLHWSNLTVLLFIFIGVRMFLQRPLSWQNINCFIFIFIFSKEIHRLEFALSLKMFWSWPFEQIPKPLRPLEMELVWFSVGHRMVMPCRPCALLSSSLRDEVWYKELCVGVE